MKTMNFFKNSLAIILVSVLSLTAFGQTERQTRQVSDFTGIDVGGAFHVFFTQGDSYSLVLETNPDLFDKITTEVKGNTLHINSSKTLKNYDKLALYITAPALNELKASGAAVFNTQNMLETGNFSLTASGAANVKMDLETNSLVSKISGAANVVLKGSATNHQSDVSGASVLKAENLNTIDADVKISGASSANFNPERKIKARVSGASNINFPETVQETEISVSGAGEVNNRNNFEFGSFNGDTTQVRMGNRKFVYVDGEEGRKKKSGRRKFDGHWGGVELGINGLLTPDHSIELGPNADFLDLRYNKSFAWHINLYEQNINLIKNHVGLVTGLGIGFNNYRFQRSITLMPNEPTVEYFVDDKSFIKNRLSASYLHLPVILEFQTHGRAYQRFHIGGGAIFGARLGTHTKQVYEVNGKKKKDKVYDDFHLSPFKADLTARIGWGKINLFANYSLVPLFRENKGPEVYPFTVGLSLTSW